MSKVRVMFRTIHLYYGVSNSVATDIVEFDTHADARYAIERFKTASNTDALRTSDAIILD